MKYGKNSSTRSLFFAYFAIQAIAGADFTHGEKIKDADFDGHIIWFENNVAVLMLKKIDGKNKNPFCQYRYPQDHIGLQHQQTFECHELLDLTETHVLIKGRVFDKDKNQISTDPEGMVVLEHPELFEMIAEQIS